MTQPPGVPENSHPSAQAKPEAAASPAGSPAPPPPVSKGRIPGEAYTPMPDFSVVRSRWRAIAIVVLVALAIAVAYVKIQNPPPMDVPAIESVVKDIEK